MALDYSLLKDEELVILCKENNNDAFSVLTQRYMETAAIIVNRFGACPMERADMIQEAMFAFLSAVYSYSQGKDCSFQTYASACMRNRIISLIRTLSSKKRVPQGLMVSLEENAELLSEPSPEESLISENSAEYIAAVISESLSEKENEVFKLQLTGFTYEEIAKKLGTTTKAVDSTLQRARKKLREKLSFYK